MLSFLKTKLVLTIIGAVAAVGATGTVAVVAAQHHIGPFAQGSGAATHSTVSTPRATKTPPGASQYHAQGLITSVTLDISATSGTLTFVADGTTQPVTVHITAQTQVEVAPANAGGGSTSPHGQSGAAGLKSGLYAVIVGTMQSDGSILAKEIQANANGKAHQGGATPTPGPGNGHHDPTPGPGNGHHTPTPSPTPHG
jgi:hypothetical protein